MSIWGLADASLVGFTHDERTGSWRAEAGPFPSDMAWSAVHQTEPGLVALGVDSKGAWHAALRNMGQWQPLAKPPANRNTAPALAPWQYGVILWEESPKQGRARAYRLELPHGAWDVLELDAQHHGRTLALNMIGGRLARLTESRNHAVLQSLDLGSGAARDLALYLPQRQTESHYYLLRGAPESIAVVMTNPDGRGEARVIYPGTGAWRPIRTGPALTGIAVQLPTGFALIDSAEQRPEVWRWTP